MPRRLLFVITLALFSLVACSVPPAKPTVSDVSSWRLAPDVETGESVTLNRGMTADEVLALLGSRRRVFKDKKASPPHESWLYRREVGYPRNVTGQFSPPPNGNLRGGFVTTIRYFDLVTVDFVDGLLQNVATERRREQASPGIAPER